MYILLGKRGKPIVVQIINAVEKIKAEWEKEKARSDECIIILNRMMFEKARTRYGDKICRYLG